MKTIFTNGCYDLLHVGHIELLKYARGLGERLIVCIDSDKRVAKMKGRVPIINEDDRKKILEAIRYVDQVEIFKSSSELDALAWAFKPDIMVVGSDWEGKPIIGSVHAKEVKYFERIPEYSTTKTIEAIINR